MTAGVEVSDLQRGDRWRLILAALIPLAAFGLQSAFWAAIQPYVWFLFYPAVFFSSWVGGLRGGLVATFLSTGLVWYFFIPPRFSFGVHNPMAFVSLAMFAGMGVLFSFFHGRLRQANHQAAEALAAIQTAKNQLEAQVLERTADLQQVNVVLRASEQEFRTLAEAMPQIVWITRPDGWNIYFNQQWVDYTGLTLEESYGHGWNTPFHPDDQQRTWDAWQRATQNNETYALECRLRRADGAYRWWLIRGVPLRDPEGITLKWFGTCTDIEDIKRAEETLRENRAKLDAALASMSDAVFISDAEGRFIEFNEAFATFHKFRNKEACVKTLLEYPLFLDVFLPNGDLASLDQWAVPRALRGEKVANAEYTLHRKDTGETWVGSYSFAPIRDKDGRIVGSVVVGRDITERKQAEEALRQSRQQLRDLSARVETLREEERTRIAREIHDELGQMLTGIKMDLRWMEHRLDDFGEDRRVNPILDKLVVTAELVDATVNTVQRIAAELRPGILDKLGLPMALQYEATQFIERTGTACGLVLPTDDPPLRPEAATAFFRIFQEALTNVTRHAHATAVEVELRAEADCCRLEIRDNGQGITRVNLAHPRSLGLLGMRERARLLGGEVIFTPRPGGGTVVAVRIPNVQKTPPSV